MKKKKIRAEIERRITLLEKNNVDNPVLGVSAGIVMEELRHLLSFIDSLPEEKVSDSTPLEEPGENLKSELHNYIEQHKSELSGYFDIRRVARHFANWQKQQMMKDAVECNVGWCDGLLLDYTQQQQDKALDKIGAKIGDKVKLIIIKGE